MRIPVARYGRNEVVLMSLGCGLAALGGVLWFWPAAAAAVLVWGLGLWFFRDPERAVVNEPGVLVAPADGKVVAVERVGRCEWTGGPAVRVDIFLGLLDVHINRSPCAAVVEAVQPKAGRYRNALRAEAARVNESNTLTLRPTGGLPGPVVVRQIAGVLARRIVCRCGVGDRLEAGERFGMIKFGSRTELYVPDGSGWQVVVGRGQKVRAGVSVMARWVRVEAEGPGGRAVETAAKATG